MHDGGSGRRNVAGPSGATPFGSPGQDGSPVVTQGSPTGRSRSPHPHGDRSYAWVGAWSSRRAQLSPNRTAVVEPETDESYTYGTLEARANRCVRALGDLGLSAGDRVAVLSRNRVELLDCFFATAKTGSRLAPLSHRLGERALAAVFGAVDPAVVIVETPFEPELIDALDRSRADPVVRALPTDDDHRHEPLEIAPYDPSPVDGVRTALSDPHLCLHTGGSTGTPKTTVLSHGAIYWNSFNTITGWGIRPDDVAPIAFPMFHTGGWNVLTVPFIHMGGTIVLRRERDAAGVLADVERESATVLVATPTALEAMARDDAWTGTDLSSLRFVKSGGAPCPGQTATAWLERDVEFSQGYGLTECGPNNFAMPDEYPRAKTESVGVPAMHVDVRIVDEGGEVVETGCVGELELAGPHAASGYRGTGGSETFGAWVSTGDLARVDGDGFIHIVGRRDAMFVTDGENVHPPRVEAAIAEHPLVEMAVVVGVEDDRLGAVGAAVVEGAESLSLPALQAFLAPRLADFAIPRHLAVVDRIPRNATGEIDRASVRDRFDTDGVGEAW